MGGFWEEMTCTFCWLSLILLLSVAFCSGERSSSGLLEWDSKSDALETLGFLNHYQMKNPSEFLCVLQNPPSGLVACLAACQSHPSARKIGP